MDETGSSTAPRSSSQECRASSRNTAQTTSPSSAKRRSSRSCRPTSTPTPSPSPPSRGNSTELPIGRSLDGVAESRASLTVHTYVPGSSGTLGDAGCVHGALARRQAQVGHNTTCTFGASGSVCERGSPRCSAVHLLRRPTIRGVYGSDPSAVEEAQLRTHSDMARPAL